MSLRVPILTPLNQLPAGVKVQDPSLPDWLKALRNKDLMTREDIIELLAQGREETLDMMVQLIKQNRAVSFRQELPVTVVDLKHDLDRDGAVAVQVYSLDYEFAWEFFEVHRLDHDTVRLVFDDPTAFNAIVL